MVGRPIQGDAESGRHVHKLAPISLMPFGSRRCCIGLGMA